MSSQISAVYPMIPALVTFVVGSDLGLGEPWVFVVSGVVYVLAVAAWIYSPLPNNNGGFGAPPARKQEWGWTSEPADADFKPLSEYEHNPILSWAPSGFLGIYWAEEQPEEDEA